MIFSPKKLQGFGHSQTNQNIRAIGHQKRGKPQSRSAAARQPYHFFTLPCPTSLQSVDLRHPFGAAPFGPTCGCSISRLPRHSVLKILLILSRDFVFLSAPILTRKDVARRSGTISNTRLGFVEKTHASEALKVLILRPKLSSEHLRCGINNGIGHG